MENKKLEQAKKIEIKLKEIDTTLTTISECEEIIFRKDSHGARVYLCPSADSLNTDKIFAEEIRTLVFKYYKHKQQKLELEFKML